MPRKPETDKPSLLDALAAAGQEDLDQVNARIKVLRKELAGLQEAGKLLSYRLNGKPDRKAKKDPGEGNGSQLVEQIYKLLSTIGKASAGKIASQLCSTPQGVGRALRHQWFLQLDSGEWTIAKAADRK